MSMKQYTEQELHEIRVAQTRAARDAKLCRETAARALQSKRIAQREKRAFIIKRLYRAKRALIIACIEVAEAIKEVIALVREMECEREDELYEGCSYDPYTGLMFRDEEKHHG